MAKADTTFNAAKLDRALQRAEDKKIAQEIVARKNEQEKDKTSTKLTLPNSTTFMEPVAAIANDALSLNAAFSPLQLKVIVYILKDLQPYITPQLPFIYDFSQTASNDALNKINIIQGDIFKEIDGIFYCGLPKKLFVKGRNYKFFNEEVEALAGLRVKFKRRNPATKRIALYTTHLFSIYQDYNADKTKSRKVTVEITKAVLEHLCSISVANRGDIEWDSDYYNKLIFEVVLRCNKRYSGILYFYLCTWRKVGGWRVAKEQLRKMLGMGGQYIRDAAFKKKVLDASRDELKEIGLDFWFEATIDGGFVNFKIITPKSVAIANEQKGNLLAILKSSHVKEEHIKSLQHIIAVPEYHGKILKVISNCHRQFFDAQGTDKEIKDIGSYIMAAIQKWFSNRKKQP